MIFTLRRGAILGLVGGMSLSHDSNHDPYRSAAPAPAESEWCDAWQERWQDYAARKRAYRLALAGAALPWLLALAGIPPRSSALAWLATLGPWLAIALGYRATQFACPSCSSPFTGSDFLGIPHGGALLFWLGIYPRHCAACGVRTGTIHAQPPLGSPNRRLGTDLVPARRRRIRIMKRLGLLALMLLSIVTALLASLDQRGSRRAPLSRAAYQAP